jgi:tetratricopeptide (TPR) repeat protein
VKAAPLEPSHAVIALEDADDREQIFDVLLRGVRSRMKFAALLSVHTDEIRGRRALADALTKIEGWRIPRNSVPAFEAAIKTHSAGATPLASDEPFVHGMIEQLIGTAPMAFVLPISIGSRTVALIVGHRGDEAFALAHADVADLLSLAPAASEGLARVLQARSKATAKPAADHDASYVVEVIVADIDKLRGRVAESRTKEAWPELAEALRELVQHGVDKGDPDEDEQLELLIELGNVEADRLGHLDRAIDAWQSAQTIDAGDPRVLDALQAMLVRQARWEECATLLEKRIALAEDPAARIALLLELAAIAHERLDDEERAIAAYERVLHWEPAHGLATRELEHLYSARQQWEPLAALLLDRASREQDDAAAVTALEAVAEMYEDKLEDMRAAFLVWLAVFRREPEREHLVEQLRRIGPAANAWDEILAEGSALAEELEAAHPNPAARVWQLVGVWTRDHAHDGEGAAHAFANAARLEQEPGQRAELFTALGEVYEAELGAPAEAIACYEKARVDEPESQLAIASLHRLYRQTGAWAQLAELLPQMIEIADDRAQLVDLHVELAGVLADHLARNEDAVKAYTAALSLEPKHPAAHQGLARIYQMTGQTEALLDASEAEADAADHAARLSRYPELAAAWQERGRFDRATATWQKLIDLEPGSVSAHRGLAGALRGNEQWGSLAAELRVQLELKLPPAEKLAVLLELGGVLEVQLDDVDGALAAYQAALGIDGGHRGALDSLARLYERSGQLASARAVLQRVLEHTPEPKQRADLFQRIGHAHLDAREVAEARLAFNQAIALQLENAAAHEGLARVHLLQDELVAGGEELVKAAELAATEQDKIRCLVDAGWVFRHRLHDTERARQCLQLVLEMQPEHGDAKQALAELLHSSAQWEALWPHLEQEVQRAHDDAALPPKDRADIFTRAARCALELDKLGTALELYDQACALDTSAAMQIERAEAMFRCKHLDAAAAAFQTIVLRHAQAIDRDQLLGVYRRLAEIHGQLGKVSQAQLFHQKVLEIDPRHRPTLKDLADLHASRGRYDEAIANLRAYGELSGVAEKSAILERVGDLYRDQLKNAPRAMSTYVEALDLDPGNRRVLQRLLDLQSTAGQWKAAVETIGRFLDHETDPVRRSAYHIAAAEIRRNELRDKSGALDDYDRALDDMFREQPLAAATRTRGFETFRIVDELITADKNWKYQEQSYRRMIKRMPAGDPALVALWDALGEVYRTRLKHYQSAIEAFELAHSLDPEKGPTRAGILAELYALTGKQQPRQVAQKAAKLVESDPINPEAYRTLGRAAAEAGKLDEAWCAARALVFLKQATADETALYKRLRANEVRKSTGYFDDDSWSLVRYPEEDRAISAVFALVWEGAVALRAGPAKAFELKPKERLPVEDGTKVIAKIFRHAARVLSVALPDVYVQPQRSGRLLLANCIDRGRLQPAVIVGRDLMTGYRDTELAAAIGGLLAQLRPAYYLKLALPSVDELEAALAAAASLCGRSIGRPQLEPIRAQFAAEMQQRIARSAGEPLRALVARLPEQPDLARWRNAVDMASQRAGLLVCGELAAAARMLATDGRTKPQQRVHELVAYSVSPAYFAARQHLGVAVA